MPRYADGLSPQRSLSISPFRPRIVDGPQHLGVLETGGVHDDVGRIAGAVLGHDRIGFDVVDTGAHQVDVVAGQRFQPAAVVLQGALAGGRVVGHHLGRQVRIVADLTGDPLGEHDPRDLADLADGFLLVRVVGVDARCIQSLVAPRPEDQEAVPPPVERKMAKRPLHAGPHLFVIVRIRKHPLRGALKHGEVVDVRSDRRRDLKSAGARADHRDVLVAQVHRVVPLAGMECRPGEVLLPVDVRQVGPVELSDCADHRARREFRRLAVAVARANRPCRIGVVPRRLGHLGLPADVRRDVVFLHDALEIGVQLGLFGEEVRPVIGRLEAVAIEVISHVDARTGVGVLVPRAADARVLLHDGERNAGLLEPDPRQQAGFTASDHDDSEVLAGGLSRGVRRPGVAAVEFHLLEHHRDVFGRHRFANQPLHHLVQQLGADGLGFRAPAISVVRDDLERDFADRGLVLFGHIALHFVEKQACRPQIAADQFGVAGHMHQRQHQGRDADVEQRFGDLRRPLP